MKELNKKIRIGVFCDLLDLEGDVLIIKNSLGNDFIYKVYETPDCFFHPEEYDVIIFDWGGMSVGNSLLHTFSRYMLEMLENNPSKLGFVYSFFTQEAIKDLLDEKNEIPFNLYLVELNDIKDIIMNIYEGE